MATEVHELVNSASWKLRTLLRGRRFYSSAQMIDLYKAHVLSYVEYRTPAVYHVTTTTLAPLDRIQQRFLRDTAGVSDLDSLFVFNLAPLNTRRDIAMLGLVHRTALGKGPPHFKEFFCRAPPPTHNYTTTRRLAKHSRYLDDKYHNQPHTDTLRRSALGLVGVYNLLPEFVVAHETVSDFQKELQDLVKARAATGDDNWPGLFSPRHHLANHPLTTCTY